jgi:hypothetical protein
MSLGGKVAKALLIETPVEEAYPLHFTLLVSLLEKEKGITVPLGIPALSGGGEVTAVGYGAVVF